MNQILIRNMTTLGILFTLVACGGGSAAAVNKEAANNNGQPEIEVTPRPTPVPTSTPEPVVIKTGDLITSDEFTFSSSEVLEIKIEVSELMYTRAYANICHLDTLGDIDYKNCVINTPLKNGLLQTSLSLGNDIQELTMAIWTYDVNSTPLISDWARDKGMAWVVSQ